MLPLPPATTLLYTRDLASWHLTRCAGDKWETELIFTRKIWGSFPSARSLTFGLPEEKRIQSEWRRYVDVKDVRTDGQTTYGGNTALCSRLRASRGNSTVAFVQLKSQKNTEKEKETSTQYRVSPT